MSLNDLPTAEKHRARVSPLLVVAAALIDARGRVLMQKRPMHKAHGGLWEFPGGKVEAGESAPQALARELHEELGIRVDVGDLSPITFANGDAGPRHVVLLLFACGRWSGTAKALDADALLWAEPAQLVALPMPPLDVSLAEHLRCSGDMWKRYSTR